jgi:predicted DNA-binding protein
MVHRMAGARNFPRQIVVRVTDDTYERLRSAAKDDRRTHTQMARMIIEDWLDANHPQ